MKKEQYFKIEMIVSHASKSMQLTEPISGWKAESTHIPFFANPFERGYLKPNGYSLSKRGIETMHTMLKNIMNVMV